MGNPATKTTQAGSPPINVVGANDRIVVGIVGLGFSGQTTWLGSSRTLRRARSLSAQHAMCSKCGEEIGRLEWSGRLRGLPQRHAAGEDGVGGDDAADALRYLVATRARTVSQRKLRGVWGCTSDAPRQWHTASNKTLSWDQAACVG